MDAAELAELGSAYLAAVCLMPEILRGQFNIPFYFGGTGLLIVVSVSLDTVAQIEGHLLTKHYDGLMGESSVDPSIGAGKDQSACLKVR